MLPLASFERNFDDCMPQMHLADGIEIFLFQGLLENNAFCQQKARLLKRHPCALLACVLDGVSVRVNFNLQALASLQDKFLLFVSAPLLQSP
jgi:hypothetical protein